MSDELKHEADGGAPELSPETLGRLAGVDEGLALVWLGALHEAGLLTPEYTLFCPRTGASLLSRPSLGEVPESVDCPDCDTVHDSARECHVKLVFHSQHGGQKEEAPAPCAPAGPEPRREELRQENQVLVSALAGIRERAARFATGDMTRPTRSATGACAWIASECDGVLAGPAVSRTRERALYEGVVGFSQGMKYRAVPCATLGTHWRDIEDEDGNVFAVQVPAEIAEAFAAEPWRYGNVFAWLPKLRAWALENEHNCLYRTAPPDAGREEDGGARAGDEASQSPPASGPADRGRV